MYTCSQTLVISASSCLCCTCSLSTGINVAGFGMYSTVSAECIISAQMLAAALRLPFLSDSAGHCAAYWLTNTLQLFSFLHLNENVLLWASLFCCSSREWLLQRLKISDFQSCWSLSNSQLSFRLFRDTSSRHFILCTDATGLSVFQLASSPALLAFVIILAG